MASLADPLTVLETYNPESPRPGSRAWSAGVVRCGRRLQEGGQVPKLEVEGVGTFDVPEDKRLVLAIEEDAGVDILHRCGSYAKCTTCRIEYLEGEPEKMTKAELEVLEKRNLLGQVRLSCQTLSDHDKKVRVLMTVSSTGLDGPGPHPESHITPEPEWVDKPA